VYIPIICIVNKRSLRPEGTYRIEALYEYYRDTFVYHETQWLGITVDITTGKTLRCHDDKRYQLAFLRLSA
jgi:hypothetical protein